MANLIQLLRSKITGHVPALLADGQIGINQKDKKLFYPDENGNICEFNLIPSFETIAKRVLPSTAFTPPYDANLTVTILDTITIPANKFLANPAVLELKAAVYFSNTGGKALYLAVSNSPILTGSTLIAETAVANVFQFFVNKTLNINASGMSWSNFNGVSVNNSNIVDSPGTNATMNATLNLTLPIYIMICVRKSNYVGWTGYVNTHSLIKY